MGYLIESIYFVATVLFIIGLKRMSHPTTARSGILWAGYGMVVATVATFVHPQIHGNYTLMIIAIAIGSAIAWWFAKVCQESGDDCHAADDRHLQRHGWRRGGDYRGG